MQAQQNVLDPRSLCGLKTCMNRATRLFAWPMRQPVPLCESCGDVVNQLHLTEPRSPKEWLTFIKVHGKAHLFPPERA